MQSISWQENDFSNEGDSTPYISQDDDIMIVKERDYNQSIQLEKFLDPAKNDKRQEYITLMEKFGNLLMGRNVEQLANDLLSDDFEIFVFSATKRKPVQHAKLRQGFVDLYKNVHLQERRVRETYIDTKKDTACQVCDYKLVNLTDDNFLGDVAFEFFTITNGRISKYRASFGNTLIDEGRTIDPFEPIRKDLMLSKVKEINYALAGQPDFERVASLLDNSVEYKIWRWDDFKCFTFYKNEFAFSLKINLEENMSIKCVIPYELSVDSQEKFVSATYLYQLEEKVSGKKYDWMNICLYGFDENINIVRISHQGELHPEGEADVPFESFSREKLENKFRNFYAHLDLNFDVLYTENILFDCRFYMICSEVMPNPGSFQGLKQIDKVMSVMGKMKGLKLEFIKPLDLFVDVQSTGYDVVFALVCGQGVGLNIDASNENKVTNGIGFVIMCFENGKLAKLTEVLSDISEPIESPFDDKNFHCLNIR